MNSWAVSEGHCCDPWERCTDAWQYPGWLGCTSLQASSQTACHLVVHVPWLHTANTGHLWENRIPLLCLGSGSDTTQGLCQTTGWHAVSSRRAGVIALEATVRFGFDILIPRAPGVCLEKHSLLCQWHWVVQEMGSPGWEQVGRVRVTEAAEEIMRKWRESLMLHVFRQVKGWFGDLGRGLIIWIGLFSFRERFLICFVLKILCIKHFLVIPVV